MGKREIKKTYLGKIGFCENKVLNIRDKDGRIKKGGHYVYIREIYGKKCNVNVITSLENYLYEYDKNAKKWKQVFDENGNPVIHYTFDKLHKVRNGYLYPIPKNDADFKFWSAINLDGNKNGVPLSEVKQVGLKKIKHRHKFFVGKYTKKK